MIYFCVPARNEAGTVGVLLWKIRKVMAAFGRDYEVLVLDDASTDATAETLERYRSKLPLSIVREEKGVGYAEAVRRLLAEVVDRSSYPKRDSAVVIQADFTEDPADIVAMVKTLEGGADIVAGAEEETGSTHRLRATRWATRFFMGSARRGAPVSDPLCGLRAYRVIVLKKAMREGSLPNARALERWAANVEILSALAPHARRIEEVPLRIRHDLRRRDSRFRPIRALRELRRTGRSVDWPTYEGAR